MKQDVNETIDFVCIDSFEGKTKAIPIAFQTLQKGAAVVV